MVYMPVKIIIADVDGCFVKEDKTKPPMLEDLTSQTQTLEEIRIFLARYPHIKLSFCTTRSAIAGTRVAELAGVNGYSAFENGNIIYDPTTGGSYLLVERDPSMKHLVPVLTRLREWYKTIDETVLSEELRIDPSQLRRLSDRKNVLTFEILPFDNPPTSGQNLWEVIQRRFLTQEISDLIASGNVLVTPSGSALDIGLNINKGHAAKHILGLYGIPREGALGIGDSYHSDTALLSQTGYKGVPSNANTKLKDSVSGDDCAYISSNPHGRGVLDILKHFLEEKH